MIERLRALFAPEPQSAESETLTRRKHRITRHLENIYKEQQRLEALQAAAFQFRDTQKYEGGFAAIQMLIGAIAVPGGILFRKVEPLIGSIIAYQGAHMFMKGVMTVVHRVWPESRGSVETRITGQRKTRKGAAAKEPTSEASLQEKIRELSYATRERQQKFREFRRGYATTKKIIPEQSRDETRENYIREYIAYLDALIDGQQEALEGEADPKGLVELAKSLKEYHLGIVGHHQERADVIGTLFATGTLLGAQQHLHGSPLTSETVTALASGIVTLAGTMLDRRGTKESALSHIESIDREIEELKRHRLETTLRLGRLARKRERTRGEGGSEPSSARARTFQEEEEIQKIMNAYRLAVQEIVHRAPVASVIGIGQTPQGSASIGTPSGAALGGLERGALAGFLGVVIPEETPTLSPAPERSFRRISPPPFAQIESTHLRREVDKQIILDVAEIAGRKLQVSSGDTGWLQPLSTIEAIKEDADVPDHALDEIVRYLGELNDRLTAHQSVRDFQAFHLADIIHARKDIQDELYRRERTRHRELIMYGKPEALRAVILRRSNIATIQEEYANVISQDVFEEQLRAWVQRKSTRDHDRASLRAFLGALEETLRAIASMPTKETKQHIIKRSYDILDEFLPEVAMPDPEQVGIWSRRLEEVAASLKRIQSDPLYQPVQRVPERLQIEAFVPSDAMREVTFASADLRDEKIKAVDTKAIVGSYVDREAWVVRDRSRIAELSEPLINDPTPAAIQSFFMSEVGRSGRIHLEETIQLLRIPGPKGPLYFTYRGVQHVAAAKVAGLPRIIARVYELRPRDLAGNLYVYTTNKDRYREWIRLKEAGLIDGDLLLRDDLEKFTGVEKIEAKMRHQTVPWLIWFNLHPNAAAPMRSIREVSQLYSGLYSPGKGSTETGPFDKLKDARGAKVDPNLLLSDVDFYRFMTKRSRAS